MFNESGLKAAAESVKSFGENSNRDKVSEKVMDNAIELIESCNIAYLGSNGDEGYPNIKAMIKVETEGIHTIWFSTNTSSKRVAQLKNNSKACVYFADQNHFKGLMLVGEVEVLSDLESKKRLWREGCEVYYPLGVDDPDYTVLRFHTKWGNYYHGLKNLNFTVS